MDKASEFGIITDLHISEDNWEEVVECCEEAIDKCVELELEHLFIAGDIFTSRKGQTQPTLFAFAMILDYSRKKKLHITAIAGNHDKMSYISEASYLDTFAPYEGFTLVKDHCVHHMRGISVATIPFFKESDGTFDKYFKEIGKIGKETPIDYLITHIAVDGVKNNDGSEVEKSFNKSRFKAFKKVFIGHYHNQQKIGKNIYYIGSLRQNNFGEDDKKGLTVVYRDGSHEQFKLNFTNYRTVVIDLDKVKPEEIDKMKELKRKKGDKVRLKIKGTKEQVAAVNKVKFKMLGYSIDTDIYDPNVNVDYSDIKEFRGFDAGEILTQWGLFSKENKVSKKDGEYCKDKLEEILNK